MNIHSEQNESNSHSPAQRVPDELSKGSELTAGMEAIRESAHQRASQNIPATTDDDSASTKRHNEVKSIDRSSLRERLLENAPTESVMKREVHAELTKKRDRLEGDVRKFKRRRNYHALANAIMQLREVVRQLEDLARASYEVIQDLWLRFVHKFA